MDGSHDPLQYHSRHPKEPGKAGLGLGYGREAGSLWRGKEEEELTAVQRAGYGSGPEGLQCVQDTGCVQRASCSLASF